jgi:uncharacterized membrane protein YdjX (TVP38/TMEM64 family)
VTEDRAARRRALIRLAAFAAFVAVVAVTAAATSSVPSTGEIRDFGEDLGIAGPIAFVPLSAALNSLFFPGQVLAGVAGLLFGIPLGTAVALAGAVASAGLQLSITRYLAREQVGALLPARVRRIDAFLERRGFLAVMYVRIIPAIPYVPMNYGAGLTRLKLRDMLGGTAVGAVPKTFAYVALGGSIDDLSRPEAKLALGLLLVVGIAGLVLGRREIAAERARP